jgi:transposase
MTITADTLVPEQLWQAIQPLLPPPPRRYGGRPRIDDRAALAGIVYQLRTGIPWRLLPTRQLGCGSPVTCWRRLRDWQRAGRVAATPPPAAGPARPPRPARLVAGQPGFDQRARQAGGELTGPNPTDRGKPGSKYHLLTDRRGIPLAVGLSAANTHDSVLLEAMVDAVPAIRGPCGRPGRPRKRPAKLHCDKGYDYPRCRRALRRRGITPRIARRGIESSQRLGRHRYVVERSLAWLVGYRRLQVRYERRADIVLGFVQLACVLICLNSLTR